MDVRSYLQRMQGGGALAPRPPLRAVMRPFTGAFLAIAAVAYLTSATTVPLVLGSFGASCVLLFGFPDNPFSQPRNVIGGHFLTSLTGLVFLAAFGHGWWSMALAVGTAAAVMHLTRTLHPPAGSNPVIVMLTSPGWPFLLTPTLIGAAILVAVAVLFNNTDDRVRYPKHWY